MIHHIHSAISRRNASGEVVYDNIESPQGSQAFPSRSAHKQHGKRHEERVFSDPQAH